MLGETLDLPWLDAAPVAAAQRRRRVFEAWVVDSAKPEESQVAVGSWGDVVEGFEGWLRDNGFGLKEAIRAAKEAQEPKAGESATPRRKPPKDRGQGLTAWVVAEGRNPLFSLRYFTRVSKAVRRPQPTPWLQRKRSSELGAHAWAAGAVWGGPDGRTVECHVFVRAGAFEHMPRLKALGESERGAKPAARKVPSVDGDEPLGIPWLDDVPLTPPQKREDVFEVWGVDSARGEDLQVGAGTWQDVIVALERWLGARSVGHKRAADKPFAALHAFSRSLLEPPGMEEPTFWMRKKRESLGDRAFIVGAVWNPGGGYGEYVECYLLAGKNAFEPLPRLGAVK